MNIKFNNNNKEVRIESLTDGDTFIDSAEIGYLEPTIFMIIDEPYQFFTAKADFDYDKYALNLENGQVVGFYKHDKVILVNCDLNVTIK